MGAWGDGPWANDGTMDFINGEVDRLERLAIKLAKRGRDDEALGVAALMLWVARKSEGAPTRKGLAAIAPLLRASVETSGWRHPKTRMAEVNKVLARWRRVSAAYEKRMQRIEASRKPVRVLKKGQLVPLYGPGAVDVKPGHLARRAARKKSK